jgi:hypothetical protein
MRNLLIKFPDEKASLKPRLGVSAPSALLGFPSLQQTQKETQDKTICTQHVSGFGNAVVRCHAIHLLSGLSTLDFGTATLQNASISQYRLSVGASHGCYLSPLFDLRVR